MKKLFITFCLLCLGGSTFAATRYVTTQTPLPNNYYNNYYSNQIKIVVYSKSGTSRNCYTPPLTWKWNTSSVVASCPSFSYSYNKSNSVHNYKNGNYSVTSGINKMNISYKIKIIKCGFISETKS